MAQAFSEGFVYSGRYSVTRGRRHGNSSRGIPSVKFVVFAQNHDQIGNRMMGDRLGQLVSFEAFKLASAVVLLSPFVPLLFMGDEYGETAPFQYFVSHSDPSLIEAVRKGRREEFAAFKWKGEPPDPQNEATFSSSKLNHSLKKDPLHKALLEFHKELLALRRSVPALYSLSKDQMDVVSLEEERILAVRRWNGDSEILAVFNFNERGPQSLQNIPCGGWRKRLDSSDSRWAGRGATVPDLMDATQIRSITVQPHGVVLFEKEIAGLMERYICIHGHFYQPPRENAWLEFVELQDSAYPFHDWNERITAECYAPNGMARILDGYRNIVKITNNYAHISFNFGPTLLAWMQDAEPEAYQAILDADKESQERFSGHGSAIAQGYNHAILPLCNSRDKYTQIVWGVRDFEHRFGRAPEGMWLPETAVDLETLDMLADCGIRFTILSPYQAKRTRKVRVRAWRDANGAQGRSVHAVSGEVAIGETHRGVLLRWSDFAGHRIRTSAGKGRELRQSFNVRIFRFASLAPDRPHRNGR